MIRNEKHMFLKITNLSKTYYTKKRIESVLKDVELELKSGEKVAVVGASGAGKTTLLNILGFIDCDYEGDYYYDGKNVRDISQKKIAQMRNQLVGFIFQEYMLLEDESVYENVKIPLLFSKVKYRQYKEKILKTLQKVHLEDYVDAKVSELSGGQRQRVAIARALVNEPSLIIADEPTAALNKELESEIMDILFEYVGTDKVFVFVTHDIENIDIRTNRVIEVRNGMVEACDLHIATEN